MGLFRDKRLIDLSVPLESDVASETWPPRIDYRDHDAGAETRSAGFRESGIQIEKSDFPDGIHMAWEVLEVMTHAGTHMDAPWHYGPTVDGRPARTIDSIPLEWCLGEAVVLDFTWKEPRTDITVDDVTRALDTVDHSLSPGEILLFETGASQLWGTKEYKTDYPGVSAEAVRFAVGQGVKVVGIDAWGLDKPAQEMAKRFEEAGDSSELWPAHVAGRDIEYCQIEKLANLDKLPRRTGIDFIALPVNIRRASAGWVRPVAIVDDSE